MTIQEVVNNGIFYLDGGTGSVLQERGLKPGELPETWNIVKPEEITRLAREYYEAGSHAVMSNTFGANCLKFDGKDGRYTVEEVVTAAVNCAKKAREEAWGELVQADRFIGLDIGSLGKLLKPLGDLEFERAVEIFKEIVVAGAKAGADFVAIETMNDSYETKAAVIAAKEACDLPIFVTTVFDESGRLMTGATPEVMCSLLDGLRVFGIGANCSLGPAEMLPVLDRLYVNTERPVIFKPNAGLPKSVDGKTVYDVEPAEFAQVVKTAIEHGARIVGGCCGTTPEFIRQVVLATRGMVPKTHAIVDFGTVTSYSQCVRFGKEPILIGERINPTGKKKLKEALRTGDMAYILGEAIRQEEAGVQVLDVNVGLPELNEPEVLLRVIKELQGVTALPLQIDTTDPVAMEQAMRAYNGKPMINSVNGKDHVMEEIFPLVAKYGGYVVCLTLDEEGIPDNAEKRLAIAEKIVKKAAEYGISKYELIFDPLAMAVSSDSMAARVTIDSIKKIHNQLGACTSLGVSNVSFGIPKREVITSVFFAMAMESGLSAAIMNPFAEDMMKSYKCFLTLSGYDENCLGYIEMADQIIAREEKEKSLLGAVAESVKSAVAKDNQPGAVDDVMPKSALHNAIVKGMTEVAASECKVLLQCKDGLEVINDDIIPALNEVGVGFEKKKVYLPQLLMSAEAAKAAFAEVSATLPQSDEKGEKVIMATVKGDIHDIGKNIVVVLLQNYGFDVIDLGKDVDPSIVTEAVVKNDVKLVGLSALMTTTVPAMEETIKQIKALNRDVKVVVGGAVLTQEYADMINADKYAANAMETVRYAQEILG